MLELLKNRLTDVGLLGMGVVYPRICPGCEGTLPARNRLGLCEACEKEQLFPLDPPFCQRCSEKFHGDMAGDFTCALCKARPPAFDFARCGFHAHELARELVHEFKYNARMHLAPLLATLLERALDDRRFADREWILVPVPLHAARKRERQFNQAEELCRLLARSVKLPWTNALIRTRYTGSQAQLEQKERLTNLQGAFAMTKSKRRRRRIENANVILIDDILTTGSTAHECAKVLKREGNAVKVAVITIGRAGHPPRG